MAKAWSMSKEMTMITKGQVELASAPFRDEHEGIRKQLGEIEELVTRLESADLKGRRMAMGRIVEILRTSVLPHAAWEESVLYPLVDRKAGSGCHLFTASMRHDHRVVERATEELERMADRARADAKLFARRTERLLGVILAHLDAEETVLLPVLETTMTSEEMARELGLSA